MRAMIPLMAALVVLSGCAGADDGTTTSSAAPAGTTSVPPTTRPLVAGCPEEGRFAEGGSIYSLESPGSDTGTIGLIGWEATDSCETFEVSFETPEGAPATTPPTVTAAYLGDTGIIRVRIGAGRTVVADQLVETSLVDRLYVVRARDGGMFIDFHLAAPAQASVVTQSSPARLVLQLQPGIVEYGTGAALSGPVVLTAPREDSTVATTVTVEGYLRAPRTDVLAIATQGDAVVAEDVLPAAAAEPGTWGEFRGEMRLVQGRVSLFVGEQDTETGRFEGVTIDLTAG